MDEDERARGEHLGVHQLEYGLRVGLGEQALARAREDRVDHQPVLVDEVVLLEPLHERAAAGDEDPCEE